MRASATIVPRLLRTKQAAEYLSMSEWSLRNLVHDGKLPVVGAEDSCAWRFDRNDLDVFVDNSKTTL